VNPIEVFYSWQVIVAAACIYGVTQLTKVALQIYAGAWFEKTARRKLVLKRLLLPLVPPLVGFLYGIAIPLHPDALVAYLASARPEHGTLILGAWGVAVGQFADYLYSKITDALRQKRTEVDSGETP
jgi:hypothetical protein